MCKQLFNDLICCAKEKEGQEEFVHITFVACQQIGVPVSVCVYISVSLSLSLSLGANNPSKCSKT